MVGEEEAMLVGVVGEDTTTVTDALAGIDATAIVDTPAAVLAASPDIIVAVGESSLLTVTEKRPEVPILPVEAGAGVRSIPTGRLDDAFARLTDGDWATDRHPVLSVGGDTFQESLALFDAMTVTAEPAHISEFTLTARDDRVASFRADGVVVATPAGTAGYARAAGAPVVTPGLGVLAIVPVAPFATTLDHWVVPDDEVTITVEREDATVEVLADDRTVGVAGVGEPVHVRSAGYIETIRLPEGRSPFATRH